MDQGQSRTVCEILAGLIFADGELHEDEARLLARVKARFGLAEDTVVQPAADVEAALVRLRGLSVVDRHETLSLLIEAAAADGVLHPAERILIGAVADELGVPEDAVDARLRVALSGVS